MQNPPAFGFGTPSAAQSGQAGLFGTATPGATNLFATPASNTTPSLFGTATTANPTFGASATPAFGATPNITPSFGATPSAVPGFGITPSAASTFGTAPNAAPSFGATPNAATGFGTTPNTAPSFGATPNTTPSFGATPNTTPSFGATPSALPSFGTTTSAAPAFGATPIGTTSFGATLSSAPSFGVTSSTAPSFGATPIAVPSTASSFGITPSSNATATPSFGATTTASAFGATTTTTAGFGVTQQPNVSGFGITPATNLPFGATTTSAVAGFGFGTTTTSAAAASATNTGLSFNLGAGLTSTPTTAASQGLGGQPTAQTKVVTTQKDITPKDQPLPNEILQTVEAFKELVKQQKLHSSDIARCSVRDFRKVEQDINQLAQLLAEVESQLQKNRQLAEKLKYETAKCLKDVEIAQRTQDTPPGLQYENTAPLKFFLQLADKFEREMQALKVQIEGADNYVKNYRSPNALTPQDLHLGMRRLHESFVALAGRLHSVHNQVESQKEAYLNTRKQLFNDNSNPFENMLNPIEVNFESMLHRTPPKVATGPTPFSNLAIGLTQPLGSQQNQSGISYSAPTTTASGFANMGFSAGFTSKRLPGYENLLFGGSSVAQNTNSFQLQKPPTGNKRGKQ
ncbi:unnamed protein product [Psylliodes chrysocephalus]|uniref:Nucleoporin p58/p45 n=1 Tax=Psylliodes chrysocephalus TaxID=3402493 RepID=A0A9P0D8Z7_9CUCU|nr:unnamed protein product [Psylliodes chrysocephala]